MKKIAVISDMSGYGRCAITVAIPIISAMGVQCCPVPTAILSNHVGFKDFFIDDYTKNTLEYLKKWDNIDLTFDAYLTGYFASKKQVIDIYEYLKEKKDSFLAIDPIMGDNGKLYSTYNDEMVQAVKKLCSIADLVIPNLTEACALTDTLYKPNEFSQKDYEKICEKLVENGAKKVCITGIVKEDEILNFFYDGSTYKIIKTPKIGDVRSGTGDVFAAVVSSGIVKGESIENSIIRAVKYINKTLEVSQEEPSINGICFEKTITQIND